MTDRAGPNPRPGLAALNRDACVAWDGVVCMSCRFACGDGAIALDGRSRPHVKADSCTGCEACVSVCPTGAIIVPS